MRDHSTHASSDSHAKHQSYSVLNSFWYKTSNSQLQLVLLLLRLNFLQCSRETYKIEPIKEFPEKQFIKNPENNRERNYFNRIYLRQLIVQNFHLMLV